MFVDWRRVNVRFCWLMWIVAAVLAMVVLAHTGGGAGGDASSVHHAVSLAH
jgi:hypothetical protein